MAETGPRSFFSYSRSDGEFVLRLAGDLRADGRAVWVDQLDIPTGARWDAEVERALKSSRCVIVILTPESAQSQNVLDEASYALDERIPLLPILLRPCRIPMRLKRLQYIDFTGDYDSAYRQLGAAMDVLAAGGGAAPASAPPPAGTLPRSGGARRRTTTVVAAAAVAGAVVAAVALFVGREDAPSAGGREPAREPSDARPGPGRAPGEEADTVQARELEPLVKDYIAAQNIGNAAALMRFYAGRVDYFGHRDVDRDFILKDKQAYYLRWPQVEFTLADAVSVEPEAGRDDAARVSYSIDFRVHSAERGESRTGAVLAEVRWQRIDGRWLIVAQRENVLARGAPAR